MTSPNVVLVVMDTARAIDVGVPGRDPDTMPRLGAFAAEGTAFANARANAPWTLPSHGTLFSGELPTVHGAHAAHKSFDHAPTLPRLLSDAGYRTVGVSNNTWISGEFGFDRGFDELVSTWQLFQDGVDFGDIAQTRMGSLNRLRGVLAKFRGNPFKNLANLVYGEFLRKRYDDGARRTNRLIAERLPEWLDGPDPLFLFVNYIEPHLEYRPPDGFAEPWLPGNLSPPEAGHVDQDPWRYITGQTPMTDRDFDVLRGLYRGELSYLDTRVGELLDLFEDAHEDTVFVITSDHGENIGDHGLMDHQYGLFETLLRVPLVVVGPGFESGVEVSTPVQLADLFPTVLDVAGVEESVPGIGRSLRDPDAIPAERPIFSEYLAPQPPIETLRERYAPSSDLTVYDRRLRSIVRGQYKYVRGSDGCELLYDLEADPHEESSMIDGNPGLRDELVERLDEHVESLPPVERGDFDLGGATKRRLEDLGYLG